MDRQNFGKKIVKEAGEIILRYYKKVNEKHDKSEKDFVLSADLETEKYIIREIKRNFPEDVILSEEAGNINNKGIYRWIIDPLDGTANFQAGISYFCVAIALEKDNKIIIAFVFDPINNNLFFAEKGKGACLNGNKIQVSIVKELHQFLISYSTSNHKTKEIINLGSQCFNKLLHNCRAIRLQGSSILDLCHLADGLFDGLIKVGSNYWDFAPGCFIVEEAGGKVTDFDGNIWSENTKNLLASNNVKHDELLKIVKN